MAHLAQCLLHWVRGGTHHTAGTYIRNLIDDNYMQNWKSFHVGPLSGASTKVSIVYIIKVGILQMKDILRQLCSEYMPDHERSGCYHVHVTRWFTWMNWTFKSYTWASGPAYKTTQQCGVWYTCNLSKVKWSVWAGDLGCHFLSVDKLWRVLMQRPLSGVRNIGNYVSKHMIKWCYGKL